MREDEWNGVPTGYILVVYRNDSQPVVRLVINASVNYAAAEERESVNVDLADGLYAVNMLAFTSVGEGPVSDPCYFNVTCDNQEGDESSVFALSSGTSSSYVYCFCWISCLAPETCIAP